MTLYKKKDEKNVTKKKIKIQASTPYAKVYSHKIANKAFRYFEWSRFFFSKAQFSLEVRYGLKTVWQLFRMIGKFWMSLSTI